MSDHINHYSLPVQKTAHYSTFGRLTKQTKYIWIVMHGYGQLSNRIIQKFETFDEKEHFVIAPEGLNRFYWHSNNEPVSCWMTKEDRYDEINDFVNYLDQVYNRFCTHVNQDQVKIVLFGFSQGCATMWRWIHASRPRYHFAINWAGWIPEDLSYIHLEDYLSDKKHHLWYGDTDKFLNESAIEDIRKVATDNKLKISIQQFKGDHKIPRPELQRLVDEVITQ
jgi:predicted esterase